MLEPTTRLPLRAAASRFLPVLVAVVLWVIGADSHAVEPLDCLIEPHRLIEVSSSEIGVLGSVEVDDADVVRKGDVIAALRTDVEQAVLDLSRARAGAVAEVELLKRDYEFNVRKRNRMDKLHNQRVVSAQNADEVRTAQDVARLRLRAATEKQRNVRLEAERDALALARRIVRSPLDGVVVRRHKSAGEYVEGDPIVQLAQLNPLRIEVVAPISLYGQIKKGMQAVVTPELAIDGPFVATVRSIDPVMDAATATFGVRLSLPNPERRLPAGLKCTLALLPQAVQPESVSEPAHEPEPAKLPVSEPSKAPEPAPTKPARNKVAADTETTVVAVAPKPLPDAETPISEPPRTSSPTIPASITASTACATLGPVKTRSRAEKLQNRLSTRDVQSMVRNVTRQTPRQLWVVLSKGRSEKATELIRRLKRANIADYQLLRRGPWKDRVSFGLYRGIQHANARVKAMQARGFDVERIQRQKTTQEFWLDLTRDAGDPALASLVSSFRSRHPGLSLEARVCAQIASR